MKKILLSLTTALFLPFGLYAEETATPTQPTADEIMVELRKDCEKIVAATQASAIIEEAIQQHQQREQELLTRFMTRGFTKDKFETLGKKIITLCSDKQDHDTIVAELMKNSTYKIVSREIDQLVCLVEELYDVMVKAAAVQDFAKEVLAGMQDKADMLISQGYTQEQVMELIQKIITEINQQQEAETTQKNIGGSA